MTRPQTNAPQEPLAIFNTYLWLRAAPPILPEAQHPLITVQGLENSRIIIYSIVDIQNNAALNKSI